MNIVASTPEDALALMQVIMNLIQEQAEQISALQRRIAQLEAAQTTNGKPPTNEPQEVTSDGADG